ncbi:RDD family protein [Paenibacillus sp. GCM10027626]|uniref:RDD family protein n=1 Tax=Paenibacillus sp. GCM10027626 TaxID=3273411 RepID=UPI003643C201
MMQKADKDTKINATFLLRLKAFLIDYLLIFIYLVFLVILSLFLSPSLQHIFQKSLIVAQFASFLIVTLPITIYFIICDSVLGGQSFGKRKVGIKTVDEKGNSITVLRAIFRNVIKFLPWEMSHYLVYRLVDIGDGEMPFRYYLIGGLIYTSIFTYILTAIFTKKKQSLYDIVAKTQVVKVS